MDKKKMTKTQKKEMELLEQLKQKSEEEYTPSEQVEFERLVRKNLAKQDNPKLTDWIDTDIDFKTKLIYNSPYETLPILYNKKRHIKTISHCVINSNACEMLENENKIPPVIAKAIYFGQRKTYLISIDFNYFVMEFASQFEADNQGINRFYQDFALRFNDLSSIYEIEVEAPNLGARTLSSILELLKVSYTANSNHYYTPIVIQKKSDTQGDDAIQINFLPITMNFIDESRHLFKNEADYMEIKGYIEKLADLTSEKLDIVTINPYYCNKFWIRKALNMSVEEFKKCSKAERTRLLKGVLIERKYYS